MQALIETQFPVSRLSAESYKERKAGPGQTLTSIGKWWGRKPLILVRAAILGMLIPASEDAVRDRDIFLRLLTMDDDGVWLRAKEKKLTRAEFDCKSYSERIDKAERPENCGGPSVDSWAVINAHLGTRAGTIGELVVELGQRQFGHAPRVGDAFCGGGSIPFEAARIGCDAHGSDLNPVAGLLSWASINLLGQPRTVQLALAERRREITDAVQSQLDKWRIEENEHGDRAEAFLYCAEVKPEGCDYYIPLSPSWVIAEKFKIVCSWRRTVGSDRLTPCVESVHDLDFKEYKNGKGATIVGNRLQDPFDRNRSWSIEALRGVQGLRHWTSADIIPRAEDIFQERLYCIRWTASDGTRRYAGPSPADLVRETAVFELLSDRFARWQKEGHIPSKPILAGYNTDQPMKERGWTHWHHLFAPRQLLTLGLISELGASASPSDVALVDFLLRVGVCANWHSKLCSWDPWFSKSGGIGAVHQVFYNQALNTLYNYPIRSFEALKTYLLREPVQTKLQGTGLISVADARDVNEVCDLWLTDPPYADAVNYHELGDFFLAWYEKQSVRAFPTWNMDARAELSVRGGGEGFRRAMVTIYKSLRNQMPDNGLQLVMFTHQNPAVWADLGMILWAAGLRVTAAWTISTETDAVGVRKGNYVQGTVCLVLRKRLINEPGFIDEVYPLVEDEVKRQISTMQALDEHGEPNFNDADYQLAAYAAALKVLTGYGALDGRDVEHEVFAVRAKSVKSEFQIVIERALKIACDNLVPVGLNALWHELTLVERYYLRALDIESRGERRKGMYEELARGFGVADIKPLLKNDRANGTRMLTASGIGSGVLGIYRDSATGDLVGTVSEKSQVLHAFARTRLRHLMFAIRETVTSEFSAETGRQYLRDTFGQTYWANRQSVVVLLDWISVLAASEGMEDWLPDSSAARILAGRLRNDQA